MLMFTSDRKKIQLFRSCHNQLALSCSDSMANNGGILFVMHHQHFQIPHVLDKELPFAVGVDVTEFEGLLVSNAGLCWIPSETAAKR